MRIVWSRDAVRDLNEIERFLSERSPQGAERMWRQIHQRVARQSFMPLGAPAHRDGPLRMLVITGTPYVVFYLIEQDAMKIEQVMHAAQNR